MDELVQPIGFFRFRINSVIDSMGILLGKWKIYILYTLFYEGKRRFMELQRKIDRIGSKMLFEELQDLEMNNLVNRTIVNTKSISENMV